MAQTQTYTDEFFDDQIQGSLQSARLVVPIILEYIRPASVVDVGCGRGSWLRAFTENGVGRIVGIDGDYVDTSKLLIDRKDFRTADLTQPLGLDDEYDLAISLEVAEHLPSSSAPQLVRSLTGLSPVVLFSAAIPGQGGYLHVNEQWPAYWNVLFGERGFTRFDPIRPRIWQNERVEWWYRQNIFLYASPIGIARAPKLRGAGANGDIELVHTSILGRYQTLSGVLKEIPGVARAALERRLQALRQRSS